MLDGRRRVAARRRPVRPQRGDGLAARIAAAFDDVGGPALLIGMDTPQVSHGSRHACMRLASGDVDAVIGPAVDGGWWAIGLRRADACLPGVPMSTDRTLERSGSAARRSSGCELPPMRDVDLAEDALRWREMPGHGSPRGRNERDRTQTGLGVRYERHGVERDPRIRRRLPERDTVLRSSCGRTFAAERPMVVRPAEEEARAAARRRPALDLGCGPGRHSVAFARRGVSALGVDSSRPPWPPLARAAQP